MQKKLFFILILQLFFYGVQAQTYEAVYACYFYNQTKNRLNLDTNQIEAFQRILPGETKFIYNVLCTNKTLRLLAGIDSMETIANVQASGTEMKINFASRTVYFPEEDKFMQMKIHETDSIGKSGHLHNIKGYAAGYYFTYNNKYPSFIHPGFIVKNATGAIQTLVTPGFRIELVRVKKVKTNLTVDPAFKRAGLGKGRAVYSLVE